MSGEDRAERPASAASSRAVGGGGADSQEALRAQREGIERVARATPEPSPELLRIAGTLRRLGSFVSTTEDDPAVLAPLARDLEALVARLPGTAHASRFHDAPATGLPFPNPRGTHPLVGVVSPLAPPLALRVEGERVVADVEFDARYEGNRGQVHGGFVAAGFDIVAVSAARLSGSAGPTGTLSVRFVAPTPLATPLRYEAWLAGREGRKLHVRGRLVRCKDAALSAELDAIVVAAS
jgi:acyl-coenzyme A thioesterase PaaI-like protein